MLHLRRSPLGRVATGISLAFCFSPGSSAAANTDYETAPGVSASECAVLVALHDKSDGPNWTDNTNGGDPSNPDWFGIILLEETYAQIVFQCFLRGRYEHMSNEPVDFFEKFRVEELKIHETEFWVWSLRPVQATLGAGVLSTKRRHDRLSDLEEAEFSDMHSVVKTIERTLRKTFDIDGINYLMLMMVDKHVHYHVLPRYADTVSFENASFPDSGWPGLPVLDVESTATPTLHAILSEMKSNLVN